MSCSQELQDMPSQALDRPFTSNSTSSKELLYRARLQAVIQIAKHRGLLTVNEVRPRYACAKSDLAGLSVKSVLDQLCNLATQKGPMRSHI